MRCAAEAVGPADSAGAVEGDAWIGLSQALNKKKGRETTMGPFVRRGSSKQAVVTHHQESTQSTGGWER
jgi:hypothetical protein